VGGAIALARGLLQRLAAPAPESLEVPAEEAGAGELLLQRGALGGRLIGQLLERGQEQRAGRRMPAQQLVYARAAGHHLAPHRELVGRQGGEDLVQRLARAIELPRVTEGLRHRDQQGQPPGGLGAGRLQGQGGRIPVGGRRRRAQGGHPRGLAQQGGGAGVAHLRGALDVPGAGLGGGTLLLERRRGPCVGLHQPAGGCVRVYSSVDDRVAEAKPARRVGSPQHPALQQVVYGAERLRLADVGRGRGEL
jgi:hypothetical protein